MLNHQLPGHEPELDATFRALADPTRRALLRTLEAGPVSLSMLAAPLPMSLPAVHQHMRILEAAGLVQCEKRGRVRLCRLEPQRLEAAEQWLNDRRSTWAARLDALGRHLANDSEPMP